MLGQRSAVSRLGLTVLGLVAFACGTRSALDTLPENELVSGQGGAASSVAQVSSSLVTGTPTVGVGGMNATGAGGELVPPDSVAGVGVGGSMATTNSTVTSTAVTSSSATVASGAGGGDSVVNCGNQVCAFGSVCCFNAQNQDNNECSATGMCGKGSVPLACMGAMDCASTEQCCAVFQQFGLGPDGYKGIACKASCDEQGLGKFGLVMCSDEGTPCPVGTACKASQILPMGFKVCAP